MASSQKFPINSEYFKILEKVSDGVSSDKFHIETIVSSERKAIEKLGLNLQNLTQISGHYNASLLKKFEELYIFSSPMIRQTKVRDRLESGAFASQNYVKNQPIFLFGLVSPKTHLQTISSTTNNRLLLGRQYKGSVQNKNVSHCGKSQKEGGHRQNQKSLHFKCRLTLTEGGGSEYFTFFPTSNN